MTALAPSRAAALALAALAACAGGPAPAVDVATRGTMREVLREGHTEGRVALDEVIGPHTVAVGATAGLRAEITVDRGRAYLAEVVSVMDPHEYGVLRGTKVRAPQVGEQATLLISANVPAWSEHALPELPDLAALESAVRAAAAGTGLEAAQPFPFRVEGEATHIELHVLDGSCPLAHPEGPEPVRFVRGGEPVTLVGFHAEDAGGRLTHHGSDAHVHALLEAGGIAGHLDEVAFAAGARLFLPRAGNAR